MSIQFARTSVPDSDHVLADGQPGILKTNSVPILKIGDGTTQFKDLPVINDPHPLVNKTIKVGNQVGWYKALVVPSVNVNTNFNIKLASSRSFKNLSTNDGKDASGIIDINIRNTGGVYSIQRFTLNSVSTEESKEKYKLATNVNGNGVELYVYIDDLYQYYMFTLLQLTGINETYYSKEVIFEDNNELLTEEPTGSNPLVISDIINQNYTDVFYDNSTSSSDTIWILARVPKITMDSSKADGTIYDIINYSFTSKFNLNPIYVNVKIIKSGLAATIDECVIYGLDANSPYMPNSMDDVNNIGLKRGRLFVAVDPDDIILYIKVAPNDVVTLMSFNHTADSDPVKFNQGTTSTMQTGYKEVKLLSSTTLGSLYVRDTSSWSSSTNTHNILTTDIDNAKTPSGDVDFINENVPIIRHSFYGTYSDGNLMFGVPLNIAPDLSYKYGNINFNFNGILSLAPKGVDSLSLQLSSDNTELTISPTRTASFIKNIDKLTIKNDTNPTYENNRGVEFDSQMRISYNNETQAIEFISL